MRMDIAFIYILFIYLFIYFLGKDILLFFTSEIIEESLHSAMCSHERFLPRYIFGREPDDAFFFRGEIRQVRWNCSPMQLST